MEGIRLILLLLITVTLSQARRGFLLTVPKVLQVGVHEKACVTFHDLYNDIDLSLTLYDEKGDEVLSNHDEKFFEGESRCFLFPVPANAAIHKRALISVSGGDGQGYRFEEEKKVAIQDGGLLTFIQTDKPIYKPGQTVKFRILSMESNLKPKLDNVPLVYVEDGMGTRVAQWTNVSTRVGLADLQMDLSAEPVLGSWKIVAEINEEKETHLFKVEEYVLPKFSVDIEMPSYILITTENIEGRICAKYTYGQPVMGEISAKICVRQPYHRSKIRPCSVIPKQKIEGCLPFSLLADELKLDYERWSLWNAKIEVTATVEEEGTGTVQNVTVEKTTVERDILKINLKDHSLDYFKPGIPFQGKCVVTHPDGRPAAKETILVKVHSYSENLNFERNYTTDEAGKFQYELPPVSDDITNVNIKAVGVLYQFDYKPERYTLNEPQAYHNVKRWYSPSGSFLQVAAPDEPTACGEKAEIDVKYTTDVDTDYTFYYQVISRGNIVWMGHKYHHFQHHGIESDAEDQGWDKVEDENEEDEDEDEEDEREKRSHTSKKSKEQATPAPLLVLPHTAEFTFNIPVTADMAPSARILVYYVRPDGETVADSVDISVGRCFNNTVSLSFSEEQVLPGQSVGISLDADPGSLCALGVVDKSVHLMGGNNQLSSNKVFEGLHRFQLQESGPHLERDTYCEDQLGEDKVDNGRFPRPIPRARRSMWPYDRYYSKFYDSSKAFKAHGSLVLSDLLLETRPCVRSEIDLRRMRVYAAPMEDPRVSESAVAGVKKKKVPTATLR